MSAMTDKLENSLIDWMLRGQAMGASGLVGASAAAGTGFTQVFVALFTGAPSDAAGGSEVTGAGYARQPVACSMAAWAGTQGPGSTTLSTGTGGATSNNAAVTYAPPTADWGNISHAAIFDSVSGGNMLMQGALQAPKNVLSGNPAPSFPAGSLIMAFA